MSPALFVLCLQGVRRDDAKVGEKAFDAKNPLPCRTDVAALATEAAPLGGEAIIGGEGHDAGAEKLRG